MDDSQKYSAQDMEILKQKIATYREGLTTLKMANSVVDFRSMEEKQNIQREDYENQIKKQSEQLESFNHTVEGLNKELSLILKELKSDVTNDHIEDKQVPVELESSLNTANQFEANERNTIKVIPQTTGPTSKSSIQQSNLPPSYKQLQSLAGRAISPQDIPNNTVSTSTTDLQVIHPQELFFNKQSAGPSGIPPNQLYNGLYKNISMKTTVQSEYNARKQVIPLKENSIAESTPLTTTDTVEKTDIVMEHFDEVQDVHEIALIDEVEEEKETINTTNETVQQDLGKEGFSFLNIFRKK